MVILQKGGKFYDSDSSHKQNGKKIVSSSSGTSDSESSSSSSSSDSDTEIKPKAKKPVLQKKAPVPKPTPAPVRVQKPAETSDSDSSDEVEEKVEPKPSKLNGTKSSKPAAAKPDPPRSNLDLLLDLDAPMEMSIPALTPVTGSATPLAPEKNVLDAKPMFVSTSSVELLNKLSTGGVQVCKFRRLFGKCPFH